MSEKARKHKKRHTVRQYFTTPLSFVAIALVAAIPLSLIMLHFSVLAVHKAQAKFPPKVADFSASDEGYAPSDIREGTVETPQLYGFSKLGVLRCDSAGLNTPVYYGNNRVSFRNGAGLSTDKNIPGQGGIVEVSANANGGFKALFNVKKGDTITFTTTWGVYEYKVNDILTASSYPKAKGETLYLSTSVDKTAFSVYKSDRFIVSAKRVSGPTLKEVQNEQ